MSTALGQKPAPIKLRMSGDRIAFMAIAYSLVVFCAVVCVVPFLMIVTGSFTAEEAIYRDGFRLIPREWSLESYKLLIKGGVSLVKAYQVTAILTIAGTFLALMLSSMTAYVLNRKDFPWRNMFSFYFYFTTLFSGGLVPWYMLVAKYLNMRNNPSVMLIVSLLSVFNILIMRNFFKSVPDSIVESAKIDGANDMMIYLRIMLPLSGPSLATVGLFIALGYWNEWYNAMIFITRPEYFPLQYYLYRTLNSMNFAAQAAAEAGVEIPIMPTQSFKLVMTVAATGPIIFLYPFVQRYFIKGITIGAVKG
ncbi:MAG: carbohydrate ABC transporter permease [Oscillospiraceae bacterium]|nr:carbohydrate ABC transporter permease [Oscillospiraceae bacterium]